MTSSVQQSQTAAESVFNGEIGPADEVVSWIISEDKHGLITCPQDGV